MAYMKMRRRTFKKKTFECPECKTLHVIKEEITLDMPYCSNCNMIVFDGGQNYCCWCGNRFDENLEGANEKKLIIF